MAKQTFIINTVLSGQSPSEYFYREGEFQTSLGIDPEMPAQQTGLRPSGLLRPTAMAKFTSTSITGTPLWLDTTNKNTLLYTYDNSGKFYSTPSTLDSATALNGGAALTNSSGNGMSYYNNYLYLAKDTDVARYGPLDGTPAVTEAFWTSTLSLTALNNTTYPSIRGEMIPNHPMFVHPVNNYLWFADVDDDNNGIVSIIHTKKSTYEGEVDETTVPSAYESLDTYPGWWPTCLGDFNGDTLAIGMIDGLNTTIKQRNAKIVLWDMRLSNTFFNRAIEVPDPLITAMKTINGALYVFSGSAEGGMRISAYTGGNTLTEIAYDAEQVPPLQGAVDSTYDRLIWGGHTSDLATSACVFALGSKIKSLNMGMHNILKSSSANATNPWVTALKYTGLEADNQPIVGWKDGAAQGLDKISTTYIHNIWRSQLFPLGRNGKVIGIRLGFAQEIAANMTLTVKIYSDDASSNMTARTITNSLDGGKRSVAIFPQGANFKNNFFIELTWTGTTILTVALPIEIEVEYDKE